MILTNSNNEYFELQIRGYEFLCLSSVDEFDLNWLLVTIKVQTTSRAWNCTCPAMLTWELQALAKWLDDIANDREVKLDLSFMEPNLSFRLIDSAQTVRVNFDLEFNPNGVFDDNDWFIDFPVDKLSFRQAVSDLDDYLLKFTPR